jgi:tetratricopeptide (TPR) repeat protein
MAQLRAAVESGDRSALHRLDEEFEDCRRAWTWSVARGERELLLGGVEPLLGYCDHRGRSAQGLELVRQALDSPAVQADRRLHAHLLGAAAQLHFRLDRYAEAEADASRALAAIGRGRDIVVRMRALNVLGTCALRLGRLDEARRCFRQVLELAPASADPHDLVDACDHLALVEKQRGHYAEAKRLSLKALTEYRRLGDHAGEALCLNNLAALELAMNDNAAAGAHLREALSICERDGLVAVLSFVLANLTEVALKSGDLAAARRHGERAVEVTTAAGHRAVGAWAKLKLVRAAVRQGDTEGARAGLGEAVRLVVSLGLPSLKFESVESLADLLVAEAAPDCARALLRWAAAHPSATAPVRDQLRAALASLDPAGGGATPRPAIDLDDLLHQLAADGELALAPLIATLRAAR